LLRSEPAIALACINWQTGGQPMVHSVAIAANDDGSLWRNDPNTGLAQLLGDTDADICNQYSSGTLGDVLVLRQRPSSFANQELHAHGSATPRSLNGSAPGSAA
jgi:hypothetical protein